jgi:hypothetical protein
MGRPITSLIFETTDAPTAAPKADDTRDQIFAILQKAPEGLTASDWQKRSETELGIKMSRFYDHRDTLVNDEQRVVKNGRIYQVAEFTPIAPITPITPKSERKKYSDYSDDSKSRSNRSKSEQSAIGDIFDDEPEPTGSIYGRD